MSTAAARNGRLRVSAVPLAVSHAAAVKQAGVLVSPVAGAGSPTRRFAPQHGAADVDVVAVVSPATAGRRALIEEVTKVGGAAGEGERGKRCRLEASAGFCATRC